jgi:glycosyltransferase involved in cell wall biosynthesis
MISILIPIYNGIEFINESVYSVLNQTYDKWELLIGINGHPQNSNVYKIAKKYQTINNKIKVFDFYKINGKANTLNQMIKYCSYNYIAILDVDDIWTNNKLEIQSQYLEKYDVIGSKCVWIGERVGTVPIIPCGDISKIDFTKVNPIINSSSIIKKQLCYWDPVEVLDDYDLWLRLRISNKKFYNCDNILVKHRIHRKSAFNSKGTHKYLVKNLFKKHNLIKKSKMLDWNFFPFFRT